MNSFQQGELPDPSQHATTCLVVLEQGRQKQSVVTDKAKAGTIPLAAALAFVRIK